MANMYSFLNSMQRGSGSAYLIIMPVYCLTNPTNKDLIFLMLNSSTDQKRFSQAIGWVWISVLSVFTKQNKKYLQILILLLLLFILTANGFSPGGSGTTMRHNTHITQNNTTIKRNTALKTTHTINTLHRMKIHQSQLQLYKVVLIKISML
jgi:hypothetical protein